MFTIEARRSRRMSTRIELFVPRFQRALWSIFYDFSVTFVPPCFNSPLASAQNATPRPISFPQYSFVRFALFVVPSSPFPSVFSGYSVVQIYFSEYQRKFRQTISADESL
jgi:hypothetical protein